MAVLCFLRSLLLGAQSSLRAGAARRKSECHSRLPQPGAEGKPDRASCIRFHGKARLVTSGPERDRAWDLTNHDEQSKDPEKKGAAVIIDLDRIEQIDSTVIMKRD